MGFDSGIFKYGKPPFTVLKRFDDILKKTKAAVVAKAEELKKMPIDDNLKDTVLRKTSGYDFYNTSKFDFEKLISDSENTSHLISYLPAEKTNKYLLDDKIRLEFESLKESFRGSIQVEKRGEFKPGNSTDAPVRKKKKDTLERIIEKVNDKYNGEFTDSDRVIISGILNMFMNDAEIKKYRRYAMSNDPEIFVNSLFPDKFMEIVAKCFLENNDTFKKLYEDTEFKQKVMQTMGKELYTELRKKTDNVQK